VSNTSLVGERSWAEYDSAEVDRQISNLNLRPRPGGGGRIRFGLHLTDLTMRYRKDPHNSPSLSKVSNGSRVMGSASGAPAEESSETSSTSRNWDYIDKTRSPPRNLDTYGTSRNAYNHGRWLMTRQ